MVPTPAPAASVPPAVIQVGTCTDDEADDDLSAFINTLLDGYDGRTGPRVVCRGNRPIELRVPPALAFRLLGNGERAQTAVRRWAARRWVRQVRPVFVLERCAWDALGPDVQRRLAATLRELPATRPRSGDKQT